MTEFPTLVYRCPGQHVGPGATTYAYAGAGTPEALAEKLATGWFPTLGEAVAAFLAVVPAFAATKAAEPLVGAPSAVLPDEAPVTREELVAKATELGVAVDLRWGNARLKTEINAKLGG